MRFAPLQFVDVPRSVLQSIVPGGGRFLQNFAIARIDQRNIVFPLITFLAIMPADHESDA